MVTVMVTLRAAVLGSIALATFGGGCGGEPVTFRPTPVEACREERPSESASCADAPTYAATINPIVTRACVPCHYADISPDSLWPLTEYGDVAAWSNLIKTSLMACAQPPSTSPFPFSQQDRETILKWTRCGRLP